MVPFWGGGGGGIGRVAFLAAADGMQLVSGTVGCGFSLGASMALVLGLLHSGWMELLRIVCFPQSGLYFLGWDRVCRDLSRFMHTI